MILFKKDWDSYPTAIVDTRTSNQTFIRYSALLREMGIDNHAFPLALVNRDLQGVDPYDMNLTIDEMTMIAIECKINPWYYFREIARAPGKVGGNDAIFRANRGNIAAFWLFFNHITFILVQIRQTGKSFSIDTLMTYLLNVRCRGTEINLLTKDDVLRSANLERLKDIESTLPYYLKQRSAGDIGNTEELTIKSLGNRYRGHLPSKSPKQALNIGRGLTSPIFDIDEGGFLYNIEISLPAALAAGTDARDKARKNGEPYGTIITTTAAKKDDRDGRYMYKLLSESAIWSEKLYDCKDLSELEHTIRQNSPKRDLRVNCTFNHRQLGYTDEWLKKAIEESLVTGEAADRDFFNIWTSGSQRSPLSVDITEKIRLSESSDRYDEISSPYGYVTRWYIPLDTIDRRMSSGHYIMSIDTSDAAGGDDIGCIVRDISTGEIVAAGNYNETNLITFAEWLISGWICRFDHLTMIIERRSTGSTILDYLILMLVSRGIDPFKRLFNRVVNDKDEYMERFREIDRPVYTRDNDVYIRYKKTFGFATSATGATSRSELYGSTLTHAAKYTGHLVKDKKTIDQILGLEIRNGRVDHAEGEHDDMCVAWVLGHWMMIHGRNLDYYGIDPRMILSRNQLKESTDSPSAIYEQEEQKWLRSEIDRLVEEIRKEKDDYISKRLEGRLVSLSNKLILKENEHFSIDALMDEIRSKKRTNRLSSIYNNTHIYGVYR